MNCRSLLSVRIVMLGGLCGILVVACQQSVRLFAREPMPHKGQIIIDPKHPQWLKRAGGKHIFVCGPGDPEDFLYRGKRNPDGTRAGDQQALIQKLIKHGGNCIYMQIVRSHGGDGQRNHNPFIDSDPGKGLDKDILAQWERWFALMDKHNILIYLFFYDDSARIWNTRDRVGAQEKQFLQTIVRKFQHHRNLIWIVAEESEEAYSTARVQAIARVIRDADQHGHVIGNHHHSGITFKSWMPGGALNHFAMQLARRGEPAHTGAVQAFRKARGRYQVIYSENTAAKPTIAYVWSCAMGGLMPMLLKMDIASTPPRTLQQCRFLQGFFESTDFYTMTPHDDLARGSTKWVLANPGHSYIAYTPARKSLMGLHALAAGLYKLKWLDCETGVTAEEHVMVKEGHKGFSAPRKIGKHCAVWVHRVEKQPSSRVKVFPGKHWVRRAPEQVGLDGKKLDAFARAVGGDGVVVCQGYLVKTWGNPARRRDWASSGKPVMSTLLFFAVQEKKLSSVDALVRPWVRKRWPGKDLLAKDRMMTFRHLADMTSGYARAEPPGTHWAYNDYAIKLYGLVLGEVFGTSLNKAALARLKPLQLEDGDLFGSRAGLGINTSPRDFARVGWFWLNRGQWAGKQLLPTSYFDKNCRADVPRTLPRSPKAGRDYLKIGTHGGGSDQSDLGPGIYGFNWWFNEAPPGRKQRFMSHLPPGAFQANGHWGRECMLMIPSLQLVVAARGQWGGTDLPRARLLLETVRSPSR